MRARITLEAGECLPQTLELTPGQPITLGRSRDNTIVLRDELASRLHAKIFFEDGRWHLRDFGLNGTRIDGARVNGAVELSDGRKIKIGDVVLRFGTEVSNAGTKTIPMGGGSGNTPSPIPAPTVPIRGMAPDNIHAATKVHEVPGERNSLPDPEEAAKQLRMDELTALCKFMTQAVETKTPHDL